MSEQAPNIRQVPFRVHANCASSIAIERQRHGIPLLILRTRNITS